VEALALSRAASSEGFTTIGNPGGPWVTALCNLALLAGRLTPAALLRVIQRILASRPDVVFLDTSSLGWVALLTRWLAPKTRVICFFHNVEFDFQRERSRSEGRRYLLSAAAEYVNEWLSVRSAHRLLTLTGEDAQRVTRLYGRRPDHLWPVCLSDAQFEVELPAPELRDDAVLFVGSGFFANREAVAFLLYQVAPALAKRGNTRIRIAGSGFSRAEWQGDIPPNVDLLGRVPNLTACYRQARAFVAPVFSGAGMKVKVAEALMYGLPVIGSPLALRGYVEKDRDTPHLIEADTPESFVEAIEACFNASRSLYALARADFVYRFSSEAGNKRTQILMEQILASSD
jgi:glycosyltransferase involved in cell wall biosynthesis